MARNVCGSLILRIGEVLYLAETNANDCWVSSFFDFQEVAFIWNENISFSFFIFKYVQLTRQAISGTLSLSCLSGADCTGDRAGMAQ